VTTITLALIDNKTTKVKRLREDRFCVFFVWVFFCVGSFFIYFHQAYKVSYLQESSHYIQTKHNRKFLLHRERLHHNLGFSWFLSQSKEIIKEDKTYINI
jgi:hypothetical protein